MYFEQKGINLDPKCFHSRNFVRFADKFAPSLSNAGIVSTKFDCLFGWFGLLSLFGFLVVVFLVG